MEEKKIGISVIDNNETRKDLINRMENIVLSTLHQICQRKIPKLLYQTSKPNIWSNQMGMMNTNDAEVDDDDNRSINTNRSNASLFPQRQQLSSLTLQSINYTTELSDNNGIRNNIVDFSNKRGRTKMSRMMIILAQAHKHIISAQIQTKRSFYYELKGRITANLFERQEFVDRSVRHVANLLQCTTWDLGFIATSKGLVAGNLMLMFKSGDITNCNTPGGVSIPQIAINNGGQIVEINYSAMCIIVVEKESIFQKLLAEGCPRRLGVILVTGKGYPDVATRMFVKMLADKTQIPIYIFVDANPHGFEIMCVFKYGSINLWWENENMICPTIHWIGVYPSELVGLHLPRIPLTDDDKVKLRSLEKRLYISIFEREELKIMERGKAEIESVSGITSTFLTSRYLAMKIRK